MLVEIISHFQFSQNCSVGRTLILYVQHRTSNTINSLRLMVPSLICLSINSISTLPKIEIESNIVPVKAKPSILIVGLLEMPLTNKEKLARRRAKIKADGDLWKARKERDRVRKAKSREAAKAKMSKGEWRNYRARENARVRRYREQMKSKIEANGQEVDLNETESPYRSVQAMGKAMSKVRTSLPNSPRKRKAVATALAKEIGINVVKAKKRAVHTGLDEDTKDKIIDFYLRDDITWQAPGRKDCVIIRSKDTNGKKVKIHMQCKYMLMSLAEAHQLYLEENPHHHIGRSKFCELRPKHVKLFDKIPHNVCVCMYHENVRLLLNALGNCTDLPSSISVFTNSIVCDPSSKECMTLECNICRNKISAYEPVRDDAELHVAYFQWQRNDKNIAKVEVKSCAEDAFIELKHQLKPFLIHVYIKRKQAAFMENITSSVDGKKIALQVDFSENATLTCQNEIQSAHWQHSQATLFTAHAWINTEERESIVIVSDDLEHTKLPIYTFMSRILSILREKYPDFQQINVFSDGPSSQFKQRFLFSNLHLWEQKFNCEMCWHFFATSHGKGIIDGLGGTVKRSVWRYIRSGKGFATTPLMFYEVAVQRNPSINIIFVAKSQVAENQTELQLHWNNTIPIANTQRIHFVTPKGPRHLLVGDTSDSETFCKVRILKRENDESIQSSEDEEATTEEEDVSKRGNDSSVVSGVNDLEKLELSIGDWIVVKYQGELFPGEITEFGGIDGTEIRADVMEKSGKYWKWPQKRDNIFYFCKDVVKKIEPPTVAGNRGQFEFSSF